MYHPEVVAETVRTFERSLKRELVEYTVSEVVEWQARLGDYLDPKNRPTRALTGEEEQFIENELLMTKASFRYWAERYAFINVKGAGIGRLFPFRESQSMILGEIGRLEKLIHSGERDDGILFDLLKARQVGGSTLTEAIGAHRFTTQDHLFGLIASDVPDNSAYLFDMFERIVEHLPFYLQPGIKEHVKNTEMLFDGGSHIWVGAGKSTRGKEGERGQLGRGKTMSFVHLSELSTWDATGQIDGALMPICHPSPRLFVAFESTAKGRSGYWFKHWRLVKEGGERFIPIFVPWYAERELYSRRPPESWVPSEKTLAHGKKCEEEGPRWLHHPVKLTKQQLYWYESTRSSYEKKGELALFLEEYCANDEEAFQFSGRGVFDAVTIDDIRARAKPILAVYEVASHADLTFGGAAGGAIQPGHGLSKVPERVWRAWDKLSDYMGYLLVWEMPRPDQQYVLSGDIGEGIELDRSVGDVTRVGTVTEPDEQVGQYVTDTVDPVDFAHVLDAIGRFFQGSDGLPAMAAVEVNNHGLATHAEMSRHLGYENFFIWQHEDALRPENRFSNRVGWFTSQKTRALIVTRYIKKVKTRDINGVADYQLNSPFTLEELKDFQTLGFLWQAESNPADEDAHDDCIIAGAIGGWVVQTLQFETLETTADARRRHAEQRERQKQQESTLGARRDYRNTDYTLEETGYGNHSLYLDGEKGLNDE